MGYTHHTIGINVTPQLASQARSIIAASDVSICGWDGTGEPEITDSVISLNGDESLGEDLETFSLGSPVAWSCKTQYRPYDEVVTAILVAAFINSGGEIALKSDGDFADWSDGIALYEKAIGTVSASQLSGLAHVLG